MNKKINISYICHSCGVVFPKWVGKCTSCNEWGSIEEINSSNENLNHKQIKERAIEFEKIEFNDEIEELLQNSKKGRIVTHISEFDNLLGGGFTEGSVILIAGEPGIGKSTLLLQIAQIFSENNFGCFYISGEESILQIKLRMSRLKKTNSQNSYLNLISSTSLEEIISSLLNVIGKENIASKKGFESKKIDLLIIDSIQTISSERIMSSMGSIAQIKMCTNELIRVAKDHNIITILVGHVTKDGEIAGPKFLEHMVDTVLYFEGDQDFRILRSSKNRYGASGEIAIFQMTYNGLKEILNPSMFFLKNFNKNISGSAIFAGIEGSRPIMTEIQALIASSFMPMPKRACVGFDLNRLSIILAVLNSRFGISLSDKEIYINVVGGLKLSDTSSDLAVASSILSIYFNKVIPEKTVIFGEIGLGGEIRNINDSIKRVKEAIKLGFETIIMPNQDIDDVNIDNINKVRIIKIKSLKQIISFLKSFELELEE
jgi:DNA repair protein RadA/Sms